MVIKIIKGAIFLTTIALITIIIIKIDRRTPQYKDYPSNPQQKDFFRPLSFFESTCPEIEMISTERKNIILKDYLGDVIIMRFTRFHPQDIPYLIYLDHLQNRYAKNNLRLFIVHLLQKSDYPQGRPKIDISAPIIEDDGYIASLFNASLNDVLIIGKDFKIKLKNNQLSNRAIYGQALRFLFDNETVSESVSDNERTTILNKIRFKNANNDKVESLKERLGRRKSVVNIFLSLCTSCPEIQRISWLINIAERSRPDDIGFIVLFGYGNEVKEIKKFVERNKIPASIVTGLIEFSEELTRTDYYRLFKFDIDPYMMILDDNGKSIFIEQAGTTRKINLAFLENILK